MQVQLTNMANGTVSSVDVPSESTVSDALSAGGVQSGAGLQVRVNRKPADVGTVLYSGDEISYSRMDLKGADDEEVSDAAMADLKQLTYDHVVSAGQREMPSDDSLYAGIFTKRLESARKNAAAVGETILVKLEGATARSNDRVAAAEKELKCAKKELGFLRYATDQFISKNNIASAISAMGLKADAGYYFGLIGVAVPPKDSSVWHTSADDGKTEA